MDEANLHSRRALQIAPNEREAWLARAEYLLNSGQKTNALALVEYAHVLRREWRLDEAEQDLIEGFRFYEKQQEGLGQYFLDSLFSDIDSLQLYAGIHRIWFRKYHRMLSKRFPFGIYYAVGGDEVRIHAVLDLRRNPAWIRRRFVEK